MRKLIVSEWMTLDGVVQSPTTPTEDPDDGFTRGGWVAPQSGDDAFMRWVVERVASAGAYLLGRRTYEIFARHWPTASPAEQVLAEPLNARPKYVVSHTLAEPLAWRNSTRLEGDVAESVAALKQQPGGDILVVGSSVLVRTLLAHDLVDELYLLLAPVIVGGGKRIFGDDGAIHRFQLVRSERTGAGAILASWTRQGA